MTNEILPLAFIKFHDRPKNWSSAALTSRLSFLLTYLLTCFMAFSEASFIQCSFHWTDRLAGSPRHCTMLFADLISQYIYLDSRLVATFQLGIFDSFLASLGKNKNQVYGACCSNQTAHQPVLTSSAKLTTGPKSLLF